MSTHTNPNDDLTVSGKSKFAPHPEGGPYAAVCVDVVSMPNVPTAFGPKDKVRIVFETELDMEPNDKGEVRPWMISAFFNKTIGEKSKLRPFLKSWRGRDFTPEELEGFSLEHLVGAPCRLVIEHTQDGSDIYANIVAVMRADPKDALKPSGLYQRIKDRPPKEEPRRGVQRPGSRFATGPQRDTRSTPADNQPKSPPAGANMSEPSDDNIPF